MVEISPTLYMTSGTLTKNKQTNKKAVDLCELIISSSVFVTLIQECMNVVLELKCRELNSLQRLAQDACLTTRVP